MTGKEKWIKDGTEWRLVKTIDDPPQSVIDLAMEVEDLIQEAKFRRMEILIGEDGKTLCQAICRYRFLDR